VHQITIRSVMTFWCINFYVCILVQPSLYVICSYCVMLCDSKNVLRNLQTEWWFIIIWLLFPSVSLSLTLAVVLVVSYY